MLSFVFPLIYAIVLIFVLWQAIRVMSRGWLADQRSTLAHLKSNKSNGDRTGKLTIHPELLDQEGRITDEELLTVRFSGDLDPPQSAETSAE